MPIETTDTLVVGAGQAGIAMSEHLSNNNVPHIVLEKSQIADAWRNRRWDSLVANGPAWHDRFPNMTFQDVAADAFAPKERVADYFVDYAKMINAPVRTGVEVTKVTRHDGRPGFRVETSDGVIEARAVVAATGPFQTPIMPPIVPEDAGVMQMHSADYRNPDQMPEGAVLVVGAGASGAQIAEELHRAGRKVYMSIGPHDRPPRWYRGRDFCWWLGVLGKWEIQTPAPGTEHVTIAISGAYGGITVDYRRLGNDGVTLLGLTEGFKDGKLSFADNLADSIAHGDRNSRSVMDEADAFVIRNGLDLPEDPEARRVYPEPESVTHPIAELDLAEAGITSIIWATGYRQDYSWLQVDAFDEHGRPKHERGVAPERGIYFIGLPWLSRRGSSFIWGVWHDAKHVADQIAIQRNYMQNDQIVASDQKDNGADAPRSSSLENT